MAGSLNKAVLIGNLGNDPEIRSTNEGKEIANFSMATSESWTDKITGNKITKTEWHRIVVFNEGLVRVIKNYVKKGSKIYIEGQLQTRKWVNAEGQERYSTEVILQGFNSALLLLDSKDNSEEKTFGATAEYNVNEVASGNNTDNGNSSKPIANSEDFENLDDEIPF